MARITKRDRPTPFTKYESGDCDFREAVIRIVPNGLIVIDENGTLQGFNPLSESMFGYRSDEVIGQNINMLVPTAFYSGFDGYLRSYLTTRDKSVIGTGLEVSARRKDGAVFPIELGINEMQVAGKSLTVCTIRDLSQRNLAKDEIQHSVEVLEHCSRPLNELTKRGLNIGVWDWNIATNEMYWSNKFKDLIGFAHKDFTGDDFADRLHPDDKDATIIMVQDHLNHLGPYDVEYRLRHRNGEYVWIHAHGQAQWDANGKPIRMAGSAIDITGHKKADERREKAEQALLASEETFRSAIDDALIGMALMAPDGRLLKVNKALCNLLGYKEEELLYQDLRSITHPDDREENTEYVRKALAGEIKTYQMEKRYHSKSGRVVWALLSVSLVRHPNGEPNYFISQTQDITERKEMERIKNEFISIVSHELRTPLTSIRGSLDLLVGAMAKDLPEKANLLLNIARQNSERLILLINDMLDMDKIASGQMRFNITEENLSPLIRQAVETNQPYASKFGVSFVALPIHAGLKVRVDSERLSQVLANLLSNAAKFSNQGDAVEITTRSTGKTVHILVTDHGPGIPEEYRPRVFDKFSQADSSGTRVKGGSGLGLHISKQIIEHMGGRIGFASETGNGSTFWVELPIAS